MRPDLVSIVLVTKNGRRDLPRVLAAIRAQEVDFPVETVAVDSGSTDGTARFLRGRVDRLERIPAASFGHGRTRNLGIGLSRGDPVVLLVQDAVPASTRWLAELVAPLREDPRLAGAFARQVPRPDASAVTRHYLSFWVAAQEAARRTRLDGPGALEGLSPRDRLAACAFDNVCSCVRRAVWERHPFPDVRTAEDLAWSKEVLLAGHELAYAPRAVVVHSHDRSPAWELARAYETHRELFRLFGLRTISSVPALLVSIAATIAANVRCAARAERRSVAAPVEMLRSVAVGIASPLGQYLGGRAASAAEEGRACAS